MTLEDVFVVDRATRARTLLELRSAQRELAAEEAALDDVNASGAVERLRVRLDAMVAQREQELETELDRERASAEAAIAGARDGVAASRILLEASVGSEPGVASDAGAEPDVETASCEERVDSVEEIGTGVSVSTDERTEEVDAAAPDDRYAVNGERDESNEVSGGIVDVPVDEDESTSDAHAGGPASAEASIAEQTAVALRSEMPTVTANLVAALEAELPVIIDLSLRDRSDGVHVAARVSQTVTREIPRLVDEEISTFAAELPEITGRIVDPEAEDAAAEAYRVACAALDELVASTVQRVAASVSDAVDSTVASGSGSSLVPVQTMRVVLDPDSIQALIAAVAAARSAGEFRPTQSSWPVQQMPRRTSFWANTWHADVLLALIALVIVIVVLVAWST